MSRRKGRRVKERQNWRKRLESMRPRIAAVGSETPFVSWLKPDKLPVSPIFFNATLVGYAALLY